jgi:hypothetical protein
MVSNGDTFCTKVAALNEIYNRSLRWWKINIKFQHHINCALALAALEKSYVSYAVSNVDIFNIKVVAVNETYNFIVLSFFIWDC